ncbi:hypothetical protein GCM10007415_16920 [Parapedobacter pyrenivorans]|uniref:TonB C-terminal domain-containing protein n=1 Tax=Parapedobacter pyrenivorans TaxID=1305674 RepID=A0A917M9Z2_9SPHI|nr:hypothetical protein [Parapedobacter pyrenivorans]GGG84384.1 hypothetical protein GCM10007415_16920 [Parapedobacter pyrenivorans]
MNENYHVIRIQQYLNGKLSREEMYQLEREALDDPLLQDALDGYGMQDEVSHRRLSLLQQRLAARIAVQAKERNAFYFGWQRLGVAATACVLMVLVLVLLWIRRHPETSRATEKEVHVELASPGSRVAIHAAAVEGDGLDALPEGGWEKFNAYLASAGSGTGATGKVTLAFDIDAQGKPTSIRETGNVDDRLSGAARRLLVGGPLWSGTRGVVAITFE